MADIGEHPQLTGTHRKVVPQAGDTPIGLPFNTDHLLSSKPNASHKIARITVRASGSHLNAQGKRIKICGQLMMAVKACVGANLRVRPVGRHIGLPLRPRL